MRNSTLPKRDRSANEVVRDWKILVDNFYSIRPQCNTSANPKRCYCHFRYSSFGSCL